MKSIKPGRAPSMMSGAMSIVVGIFGVIWTIVAASAGGGLFALFGIVFIAVAIGQAIFHFKNATSPNRYSTFDVVEHHEEPDPLNQRFSETPQSSAPSSDSVSRFCPYCGTKAEEDFAYCNRCGKKLP